MKWLFESEVEDLKIIFRDTGVILMGIGLFALVPVLISLVFGDFTDALFMGTMSLFFLGLGYFFHKGITEKRKGSTKHALISIALVWILSIFLGSIPFLLIMAPIDALFESTAGFTTTGFTLIKNVFEVGKGLLFWRALMQFLGGLLFVSAFLALSKAFEADSEVGFQDRMRDITGKVLKLYASLLVAGVLLLLLSKVSFFEALSYSMTSISTGGFSVNGSLGALNNSRAVVVTLLLTLLGSLNILLLFKIVEGDVGEVLKNAESYGLIFLVSSGVLALRFTSGDFLNEMFHILSAITTSGFMVVDTPLIREWGEFYKALLIFFMLIGGSVYSTAGGLKIHRIVVLLKSLYWRLTTLLPDRSLVSKKIHNIEDLLLTDEDILRVYTFVASYIMIFGLAGLFTAAYGYPVLDSFFESTSALSNVGLSTGIVSPVMPLGLKGMYIILMLIGRLEVMALIGLVFYLGSKLKAVTIGR